MQKRMHLQHNAYYYYYYFRLCLIIIWQTMENRSWNADTAGIFHAMSHSSHFPTKRERKKHLLQRYNFGELETPSFVAVLPLLIDTLLFANVIIITVDNYRGVIIMSIMMKWIHYHHHLPFQFFGTIRKRKRSSQHVTTRICRHAIRE